MRNMKKRIAAVVLGVLTAVSMIPTTAFAAGSIETDRECKLTIQYTHDNSALSNVEFDLYRIADVDEYARLTLTEEFEQYQVDLGDYKGAAWNELASTLDSYISQDSWKQDGPKAVDSGKTNNNGVLTFPNQLDSLKAGLYLVVGETVRRGDYKYSSDPAIILLPREDAETNTWVYEVDMYPKNSAKYDPDDDNPVVTKVSRKVLKRWSDSGFEAERPNSVMVNLLKDGVPFDTVTLSDSNNWSYTWKDLDKNVEWKVTEEVPEGYNVAITREGNTFVVKNTKLPTEVITDPDPIESNDPNGVLGEYDENDPFGVLGAFNMLPQTGTTWWLAVTLAGAGMLLLALGLVFRRKAD